MLSDFNLIYKKKRNTEQKPGQSWKWHERELREFLEKSIPITSKERPIRIYVDALDESCQDVALELVNCFQKLTSGPFPTKAGFSICFSCRHYPVVAPTCDFKVCVEDENHQDIAIYVRRRLNGEFSDRGKAQKLEQEIIGKAAGISQWVILVIRIVVELHRNGAGVRKICQKIKELLDELGGLYEDVLSKIKDRSKAVQLMQWVCFAQRPLSLRELRFAMVVDATTPYTSLEECQSSVDLQKPMKR